MDQTTDTTAQEPQRPLSASALWWRKWLYHERNNLPWNRLRIHSEFARRGAFARMPIHGEVLEAFREGRLEVGPWVHLEPHVWLTAPGDARIRIGAGTFLNLGVMVAALELVEIGAHCMVANGCFISDAQHRYDNLSQPLTWQGFRSRGPTIIADNCWLGAHVVVAGGVRIGERCVVGANAVVTSDLPPRSIAVGVPAQVIGRVGEEAG